MRQMVLLVGQTIACPLSLAPRAQCILGLLILGRKPQEHVMTIDRAREAGDSLKEINMSDSYTNLLYHIVFSTKDRRPLITPEYELRLYDYIGGTIRSLGGICLELNGSEDHIHLLAKLRADRAVSDVLRDLKANASGWMHDVFPSLKGFSWQRGYGAFTVSHSNVNEVRRYIARQKEHHRKVSFRDEFIQFLNANGIKYDERFI